MKAYERAITIFKMGGLRSMKRRDFLKTAGVAGVAGAAATGLAAPPSRRSVCRLPSRQLGAVISLVWAQAHSALRSV